MQENDPGDGLLALLDEYLTAREADPSVELATYEELAGDRAADLRRYVAIAGGVEGLTALMVEDAQAPGVPEQIGRFRIDGLLGAGGHSRVFRAHDPKLDRSIALKVLSLRDERTSRSSVAEARSLARFDHPSVVKVFEVGEHQGQVYIAMERVMGVELRAILRRLQAGTGPTQGSPDSPGMRAALTAGSLVSTAARCRLVARVARALGYCHREGVVHRDVKPENIVVDDGQQPKLIDFGLARAEEPERLNVTQGLRGTPAYLAPEQVDQGTGGANAASDQFALGVVLYELLALEHPFRAESLNATMSAISAASPIPLRQRRPEIPRDVELICMRCLERDPARRYPTVTALAEDLEAFLEHRAVTVRSPSMGRQAILGLKRHRRSVRTILLSMGGATLAWFGLLALSTEGDRGRFVEAIRAERSRLPEALEPGQLKARFEGIMGRWSKARQFDDSAVGRLRGSQATAELEQLWRATIAQLRVAMKGPPRMIEPAKNELNFSQYFEDWGGFTYLAEYSAPPGSTESIRIGHESLDLPPGGRLQRYDPGAVPSSPRLMDVSSSDTSLPTGLYRFSLERDGVHYETEFTVRLREPSWSPPLARLDPVLEDRMIHVPGGVLPPVGGDGPQSFAAFMISPSVVTWGELRQVLAPDELAPLAIEHGGGSPHDDHPAVIPWVFAEAYAGRVGARIPTPAELTAMARSTSIQGSPHLDGEWTSTVFAREPELRFTRAHGSPDLGRLAHGAPQGRGVPLRVDPAEGRVPVSAVRSAGLEGEATEKGAIVGSQALSPRWTLDAALQSWTPQP